MNQRIGWIDTAKGIGIFLVVLGHTALGTDNTKYFYLFHMPLFFFLSGLVFNANKFDSFVAFLKSRVRSLLVPYLIFSISTYVFWLIIGRKFGEDAAETVNLIQPFAGIFYSVGVDDWMVHNVPLWFLTCLFVLEIVFFFLSKLKRSAAIFTVLFTSIVGGFYSVFVGVRLPWSIDIAMIAILFYAIAYYYQQTIKNNLKGSFGYILLGILGIGLVANLNGYVDMNGNTYGNFLYYYLGGFLGIALCLMISKKLEKTEWVGYLGRNSLIVMALHNVSLSLVKGVMVFGFGFSLDTAVGSWFWSLLIASSSILVLMPVSIVINKHFPFVVGKRTSNQKQNAAKPLVS